MRRSAFLLCLLLLVRAALYSQQDISLQNIVPPSPEASSFVKYGTYPTGPYTGRPNISIPIYEIKAGKMTLPVSLSYDATGIRVNDQATWVGQNWSLDAGGMVSQIIVGQPDMYASAGLAAVPPRAVDIVNNATYFNYLQSLVDGDISAPRPDGDPDKYSYSINGKSGSFVFDYNRNIMQIPKTSVKILLGTPLSGTGPGFTIIDESGTQYVFSISETTESYNYAYEGTSPYASASGSAYKNQVTAYYLSEMISQEGDHIYFTYENGVTASRDDMYSESFGDFWTVSEGIATVSNNNHRYRWTGVQRVVTIPRLKTISFPNGKLDFSRVADRQDDAGLTSASRLDEIAVYQKNGSSYTKLRSFKFVQGYYYSSDTYGQYSGIGNQTVDRYRLRLDELKLRDADGGDVSSYKFSYNSTLLPPKTSCSQDWWGYYNGKPNITLVPTTTNVPNGTGGTTTIGNGDRTADETYMKAGILEKIIYPTGGYTSFETEAHELSEDYVNSPVSYSATGLGLVDDKHLVVTTFTTSSTVVLGSGLLNIAISPYGANDQMPFVKIKNMSTGVEQTFTAPGNSSGNSTWYSSSVTYEFAANTTYQLTGSCYVTLSNSTANISASFNQSVYSPHLRPVGGLRIKSIKNYNSDNTLAYEENYRYGENENGAGVFVGIPVNSYIYNRGIQACIPAGDIVDACISALGNKGIFLGGALFDQALVQGSPVVYTDVVKYYGNPTSNAGKTAYNYGTAAQQAVQTLPAGLANNQGIIIINDTWKKGQLVSQKDYRRSDDGSYSLVQESQNTYNIVNSDATYGLVAQTKFDRQILCPTCPRAFTDYAFAEYPVNSGYVQLTQNVKNLYSQDGSGSVNTTVNYTYDPAHPDINTGTSSVNSKGQSIETSRKYPFNKTDLAATDALTGAESTTIDSMVARNMISPVMEEIQKTAGVQTSRKRTQYDFVNSSVIAPVSLKLQTRSNPIETRIQYIGYDNIGNLLQQRKAGDADHSYIWDYEYSYPIAEVANADIGSIAYTSFESDGTGYWTVGSTTRDMTSAITGKRSYILNSDISKNGLSASRSYFVTYWTQNFSSFSIAGTISGYPTKGKTINGWTLYVHKITGQTSFTISGSGHIDELRLYPADAQMTTYTYQPLVGMTASCDAGSRITYYEYDRMQRLHRVRDQDYNIVKTFDYQFQGSSGCGTNCYILPMRTMAGTNTLGYPVGVFSVNGKLLGNAANAGQYLTLWNGDSDDSHIGVLSAGGDALHFNLTLNTGQTLPSGVTGCRYYQVDLAWNQLDGVRNFNGCYVDFGDGTGMRLGANLPDTLRTLAPNTIQIGTDQPQFNLFALYLIHSYPDTTTLRTITLYHNDAQETFAFDNVYNPATSLARLKNLRGNLPQQMTYFGGSSYQQASMLSIDSIANWSAIHTIRNFHLNTGDAGVTNMMHFNYVQDFMAGNLDVDTIQLARNFLDCYFDSTFKLHTLKSDWNTYFKNLKWLSISDRQWDREDLSALTALRYLLVFSARQYPTNDPTNNPFLPLPSQVADSIFNQISRGAGQYITNGVLFVGDGGTTRSPASDAAVAFLLSRGWTLYLNEQQITAL